MYGQGKLSSGIYHILLFVTWLSTFVVETFWGIQKKNYSYSQVAWGPLGAHKEAIILIVLPSSHQRSLLSSAQPRGNKPEKVLFPPSYWQKGSFTETFVMPVNPIMAAIPKTEKRHLWIDKLLLLLWTIRCCFTYVFEKNFTRFWNREFKDTDHEVGPFKCSFLLF